MVGGLYEVVQKCRVRTGDRVKWLYLQWMIGFHIEMFPLWTFVGYKHPTPSILGQSVFSSNIDDNRRLQWCLILASDGRHKIIANRKMGDESVYNKWWKQPNKYKAFGVTIHEIEEAMNISDNKPFEQSEESSQDWKNCWTYLLMSSKSLCYLDMMITPKMIIYISLDLKFIHITSLQLFYLFASWTIR